MQNYATIQGRLTADPELRFTSSNVPVCSFCVACQRDVANDGQKLSDFFNCTAWQQGGEFIANHYKKGNMIFVSGRLQNRDYTDKNGNKRTVTELVVDKSYFGEAKPREGTPGFVELTDVDDELPY